MTSHSVKRHVTLDDLGQDDVCHELCVTNFVTLNDKSFSQTTYDTWWLGTSIHQYNHVPHRTSSSLESGLKPRIRGWNPYTPFCMSGTLWWMHDRVCRCVWERGRECVGVCGREEESVYDTFHWEYYTPETHLIHKLELLSTNSNQTIIWIWICIARYRHIWDSGFAKFLECSTFTETVTHTLFLSPTHTYTLSFTLAHTPAKWGERFHTQSHTFFSFLSFSLCVSLSFTPAK